MNSTFSFIATRRMSTIPSNLVKSAKIAFSTRRISVEFARISGVWISHQYVPRWFNWRGFWESARWRTHDLAKVDRQDCQSDEAVKHFSALRQ